MESFRTDFEHKVEFRNEQGALHRLDGPAYIYKRTGTKYWYVNGILHRENGPAIEYSNDSKSWYLNGIQYSKEIYKKELIKIKLKHIENL